eukprot:gnl/MRDRNA2_/MRDRNA2_102642_c0_seq1.p1 gnl/MRDRNA2_/MRDRNA2_102642_c0~~gnl/MRDRNA2_/MRDRNA2_102642_c0_seq1.p1  ORF type:complete len:475 (-),score=82.24 gnl/MRDRNA2_/MRDRNA2_102642_c0_seq1:156-1580(-)
MRTSTILIIHAFTVWAHDTNHQVPWLPDSICHSNVEFTQMLSNRALKTANKQTNLHNTMLAKPGHLGISDRISSPSSMLRSGSIAQPIFSQKPIALRRCQWVPLSNLHSQLAFPGIRSVAEHNSELAPESTTAIRVVPGSKVDYAIEGADLNPDLLDAAPSDFLELLGIQENATAKDVKAAYRRLQKISHPDIAGEAATPLAAILNMAYNTLIDDDLRAGYVEEAKAMKKKQGGQFDGRPVSHWAGPEDEDRAIFVDEGMCVGCKSCVLWAPHTFNMETRWGRARCTTQWGDDEETMQVAIDTCPVECIYWVKRDQLAILEFAMKGCVREDTHIMALGTSKKGSEETPFHRAERMMRFRQEARTTRKKSTRSGKASGHDEVLAGAIAAAWLELPADVKRIGWPDYLNTASTSKLIYERNDLGPASNWVRHQTVSGLKHGSVASEDFDMGTWLGAGASKPATSNTAASETVTQSG